MPSDLGSELAAILGEYAEGLEQQAAEDIRRAGRDAARYVRENAAEAFGEGEYSRGWRSDFEQDAEGPVSTVHNAGPHSSLGHLLESGHEQFYMGRDLGYRYPGVRHVEPAYERAAAEAIARIDGS